MAFTGFRSMGPIENVNIVVCGYYSLFDLVLFAVDRIVSRIVSLLFTGGLVFGAGICREMLLLITFI